MPLFSEKTIAFTLASASIIIVANYFSKFMNKTLYLIIGILIIIICVMTLEKSLAPNNVSAGQSTGTETVKSNDYITIGSVSRNGANFIWLMDTQGKKLLVYEYINDNAILLKAARDIQYDLGLPKGTCYPSPYKPADPTPSEVKKWFGL